MPVSSKINLGSLLHLRASFPENDLAEKYHDGEPPLRSELFSVDQMEQPRVRVRNVGVSDGFRTRSLLGHSQAL